MRARRTAAALAALTITAGCTSGGQEGTGPGDAAPTTEAPPPGEWTTFGYDLANTRMNPDEAKKYIDTCLAAGFPTRATA